MKEWIALWTIGVRKEGLGVRNTIVKELGRSQWRASVESECDSGREGLYANEVGGIVGLVDRMGDLRECCK